MSVKLTARYLAVAASAVTILAGATAGTARAATPSCGGSCISIFNDQFGDGQTGHPGFLMDSFKQGTAAGTPVILFRESNADPAEDFVIENQATVADLYAAGLVSVATALHYGCVPGQFVAGTEMTSCVFSPAAQGTGEGTSANLEGYEFEYSPFGAPTGECAGVAGAPAAGEKVTLQPCGISGKTIWIVDAFDGSGGAEPFGDSGDLGSPTGNEDSVPLINGANSNFSHPFVMTYPAGAYPTDRPRPVLYVTNLTGHFTGIFPGNTTITNDVDSDQLWDGTTGPVQV